MTLDKYRRQAKFAAWFNEPDEPSRFPLNPFAKWRLDTRQNSLRNLEDGEGAGPRRTATDDPNDYRVSSATERRDELAGRSLRSQALSEPNARSRIGPYSPGDDVQIRRSQSPEVEEAEKEHAGDEKSSDTLTNPNSVKQDTQSTLRERANGKKDSLRKLFSGKSSHQLDDGAVPPGATDDDNNGKDKKFTAMNQLHATLFNSWVNVLLVASPVGIALYYANVDPVAVFVVNFIAIIPLAGMLSYATEEIALRTGEVVGGLLNASFGNAVELIVSIIALAKDQVLIVQTSLIGSMLSNLLLVMGMCFFFGGINRMEQAFNMTVAQTASSLLFLAVSSLIIPTAFDEWANTGDSESSVVAGSPKPGVASLSRGTAIMLLIVYACYLFFQLKSHAKMYNEPSAKNEKRHVKEKFKNALPDRMRHKPSVDGPSTSTTPEPEKKDEPEEPQLSIAVALLTLAISTVLVALNAEYLVDSIDSITCGGGISKNFVGLILLPIVGNAAEHATAVTVAVKDKMDLAIGVAVGSSMQIALLILPLVVVLGWIIGKDNMTLFFDGFQIAVLFVAVLLVNYLIQDGKSHWLEGVLLMTLYIIIAVAAWFYPTAPGLSDCPASS